LVVGAFQLTVSEAASAHVELAMATATSITMASRCEYVRSGDREKLARARMPR
jgi:hypothetical protein